MKDIPKRYVICTTARSGSNLVCDYIANTSKLGKPTEFLNPDIVRRGAYGYRYGGDEPTALSRYITWIAERYSTPNSICGIKLLFEDFDFLGGFAPLRDFMSDSVLIRLRRNKKLSQAISYYLADQTGQWISTDTPRKSAEDVDFDFEAIRTHLDRLCWQDAAWDARLDSLGLAATHWVFEDFVRDPGVFVRSLAESVGADTADLPMVTHLERQSTIRSDLFRDLYITEARKLSLTTEETVQYGSMAFVN